MNEWRRWRAAAGARVGTAMAWSGCGVGDGYGAAASLCGVGHVAMSGDGKRVVSRSWDRTVRVRDGETGYQVGETMTGHTDQVTSVAMSGEGNRIWS